MVLPGSCPPCRDVSCCRSEATVTQSSALRTLFISVNEMGDQEIGTVIKTQVTQEALKGQVSSKEPPLVHMCTVFPVVWSNLCASFPTRLGRGDTASSWYLSDRAACSVFFDSVFAQNSFFPCSHLVRMFP